MDTVGANVRARVLQKMDAFSVYNSIMKINVTGTKAHARTLRKTDTRRAFDVSTKTDVGNVRGIITRVRSPRKENTPYAWIRAV